MKHTIVSKLVNLGATYYWWQGANGFVADRKKATEYRTHEDAYMALVDEDLAEIAEVRTEK